MMDEREVARIFQRGQAEQIELLLQENKSLRAENEALKEQIKVLLEELIEAKQWFNDAYRRRDGGWQRPQ